MALAVGSRLGAHEIIGLLGAGRDGEVYRARDTKLNREVAIKVLPDTYAADPERVARFHREAQAVAALNHPNIGSIYDLAESGETKFLVLELVEGETLADRLRRGPVPVAEALAIARQIVEALEVAHEKGVCHRDLKPANIKLTREGTVKVLDFGLAKFLQSSPAAIGNVTYSPTLTVAGTLPGVILGTAGYMSPEQAKGYEADQRSDIFSFGCIFYEMLTGRQAFEGETASEILASVMKVDVDLKNLPPRLNPRITELLRRCLEKDPKKRWHAAADVRVEIESVVGRGVLVEEKPIATMARPLWKRTIPIATALIIGGLAAGYGAWRLKPEPARLVTRFSIPLLEGQTFTNPVRRVVALSPDGSRLVYAADQRLYVRSMSTLDVHAIPGSDIGGGVTNPVFSPDGQALAFYNNGALKRLSISGGAAVTICAATNPVGMSWDEHAIVFGQEGKGILTVSPNGGRPEMVAAVGADQVASSPQMLPDGGTVLFSIKKVTDEWDKGQIVAQKLGTPGRKVLIDGGADGRYLPTGHLVYALSGVLLAVPFDARSLELSGGPVPVIEGIRRGQTAGPTTGVAQFSYSSTGSIAYLPGPVKLSSATGFGLALFDRKGGVQPLKVPPALYRAPRVSPDGRSIAVDTDDGNVWLYDLSGASAIRRLTFGGKNRAPVWSPDGQWIAFQSDREGDLAIFRQRADGSGTAERLTKPDPDTSHVPDSWAPDGAHLLFEALKGQRFTLWSMAMTDHRVTQFGNVQSVIRINAAFSPDGRWVAYTAREAADEAGLSAYLQPNAYLQPFPSTGCAKYLVPQSGGHPYWIRKTGELILNSTPTQSFAIAVTTTPSVVFGRPADFSRVGRIEDNPGTTSRTADALPDSEHVIGLTRITDTGATASQFVVVLNWFDELKARVPVH